jgi:hypothetical protein
MTTEKTEYPSKEDILKTIALGFLKECKIEKL